MNKKVVKALFADIVSKDPYRPAMCGVFFDEGKCVATDTHLLVVYNEGEPRFEGKIINAEGEEIKGKYPAYERVIPTANVNEFKGDLGQLYRAVQWWCKQPDTHEEDVVVLGAQNFMISSIKRALALFSLTAESRLAKLYTGQDGKPAKIVSPLLTVIIMPYSKMPDDMIDAEREEGSKVVVTYANLINTYALESSKPKEATPSKFDWL